MEAEVPGVLDDRRADTRLKVAPESEHRLREKLKAEFRGRAGATWIDRCRSYDRC